MSEKLTLSEIFKAAERVKLSPNFERIVKNNRRHLVLEIEGQKQFVSIGFLCAELDVPGYSLRHTRHNPRREGRYFSHEGHLRDNGIELIEFGHPEFNSLLQEYLENTSSNFGLDLEWKDVRVQNGRNKDFAFLVPPKVTRDDVIAVMNRLTNEPNSVDQVESNWFVAHPDSGDPFSAEIVWDLASTTSNQGSGHSACVSLASLGFEVAELKNEFPEPDCDPLTEGAVRQVTINVRERNSVARQLCINLYRDRCGSLTCVACDFDFAAAYGSLGEGYIHVHHLNPISEAKGTRHVLPEIDLVPVCPNCHAMIHRGGENRPIAEIRKLVKGF